MTSPAAPQATMHIGALAERTGMSLRTLRHYDEVGILRPSGRSPGGFRLYTDTDLERLLLIRRMKPLGYSLEEMSDLLALVEDLPDRLSEPDDGGAAPGTSTSPEPARERLAAYVSDAERRRDDLARKLAMADELLERLHAL